MIVELISGLALSVWACSEICWLKCVITQVANEICINKHPDWTTLHCIALWKWTNAPDARAIQNQTMKLTIINYEEKNWQRSLVSGSLPPNIACGRLLRTVFNYRKWRFVKGVRKVGLQISTFRLWRIQHSTKQCLCLFCSRFHTLLEDWRLFKCYDGKTEARSIC